MFSAVEPKLPILEDTLLSWMDTIRAKVDGQRIRNDVITIPAPRNRFDAPEAMSQADDFILGQLKEAGWSSEKQPYTFENETGVEDTSPDFSLFEKGKFPWKTYERLEGVNIVATKRGTDEPDKAIVVLAHHDTVRVSPGANDNTAAVASILELARVLGSSEFHTTVVLALVDMEEIYLIGSKALVESLIRSYEIIGVVNYECLGYTSSEPGSQTIIPGMGMLYRQQVQRMKANQFRGDFACLIYNRVATHLAVVMATALNQLIGNPSTCLLCNPIELAFVGKILKVLVPTTRSFGRSDHLRFWEQGIPALEVTDTGNYRYQHYHQPTDTPEKLNYDRLAQIVTATAVVIADTAVLKIPQV